MLQILSILITAFSFLQNSSELFPDLKKLISPEYTQYQNIIPIAKIDARSKGISDPIPVMYIWFDPSNKFSTYTPPEYCSNFSFHIQPSGLVTPNFKQSALSISKDELQYFLEGYKKYLAEKKNLTLSSLIDFSEKPDWWQDDDTPLNSKGKPMKFICQLDIRKLFNDDCRMFVFYDKADKIIRYIYQRV